MRGRVRGALWALVLHGASGCFLTLDIDRFEGDACGMGGASGQVDLALRLRGDRLAPEEDGPLVPWGFAVVREVPGTTGEQELLLLGLSQGFLPRDGEVRPFVVDAVPAGRLVLYVWEDVDGNGRHDLDAGESAWWSHVCDGRAAIDMDSEEQRLPGDVFEAVLNRAPGDFSFEVRGMSPHVPGMQHLRGVVVDDEASQVVAWFEHPDLREPNLSFRLSEVLRPNRRYTVEFYADITEDGTFQQPGASGDHAWRLQGTSDAEGRLTLEFDHHGRFDRLSRF